MRLGPLGLILTLNLSACTTTWQGIYASASVSADFIERTHAKGWSEPLRARHADCDATLPDDRTDADVDACMGQYAARNPDVVVALEHYNAAADVLATVLLATDPNDRDQADVLEAWGAVLGAARDLLRLFPDADKHLRQLDAITSKAPR